MSATMRTKYFNASFRPFIFGSTSASAIVYGLIFGMISAAVIMGIYDLIDNFKFLESNKEEVLMPEDFFGILIGALFFAPPVETLIFQVFAIEAIRTKRKFRTPLALLFSASSFSAAHLIFEGSDKAFAMFFLGSILAIIYSWSRKFSLQAAFLSALATHAAYNGIILAVAFYLM